MVKNRERIKILTPYINVFIDTSVYISGLLSPFGASFAILQAAEADALRVYISTEILLESHRVFTKKLVKPDLFRKFQEIINSIRPIHMEATKEEVKLVYKYCNDFNDAPMLACALKSGSRYFITLDKKSFRRKVFTTPTHLKIIRPGEFIKIIKRIMGDKN